MEDVNLQILVSYIMKIMILVIKQQVHIMGLEEAVVVIGKENNNQKDSFI